MAPGKVDQLVGLGTACDQRLFNQGVDAAPEKVEPQGVVDHPNIRMATSVIDYIFRVLGLEYLGRTDLVQVPPKDRELPEPPKGLAVDAGVQMELNDGELPSTTDPDSASVPPGATVASSPASTTGE